MKKSVRLFSLNIAYAISIVPLIFFSFLFEYLANNRPFLMISFLTVAIVYLAIAFSGKPGFLFQRLDAFGVVPKATRLMIVASALISLAFLVRNVADDDKDFWLITCIFGVLVSSVWAIFENGYRASGD